MAGISILQHPLPRGPRLPSILRWKFYNPDKWPRPYFGPLIFAYMEAFGKDASLVIIKLCKKSRELLLCYGIVSEFDSTVLLEFADEDTAYEFFRYLAAPEVDIDAQLRVFDERIISTITKETCFRMAHANKKSYPAWLKLHHKLLLELEGVWQMNHGK